MCLRSFWAASSSMIWSWAVMSIVSPLMASLQLTRLRSRTTRRFSRRTPCRRGRCAEYFYLQRKTRIGQACQPLHRCRGHIARHHHAELVVLPDADPQARALELIGTGRAVGAAQVKGEQPARLVAIVQLRCAAAGGAGIERDGSEAVAHLPK